MDQDHWKFINCMPMLQRKSVFFLGLVTLPIKKLSAAKKGGVENFNKNKAEGKNEPKLTFLKINLFFTEIITGQCPKWLNIGNNHFQMNLKVISLKIVRWTKYLNQIDMPDDISNVHGEGTAGAICTNFCIWTYWIKDFLNSKGASW